MDVRRAAADLVLRTSSSYSASVSSPAHSPARLWTFPIRSMHRPSTCLRTLPKGSRPILTSASSAQQGAAAKKEEDDANRSSPDRTFESEDRVKVAEQFLKPQSATSGSPASSNHGQPPAPRSRYDPRASNAGISKRLDFLRRPPGQQAQQQPQQDQPSTQGNRAPSSIDELLASMRITSPSSGQGSRPGRRGSPPTSPSSNSNNRSNQGLMLRPSRYGEERDQLNLTRGVEADLSPPPFQLGPSLGRMVRVSDRRGMDVARAFQIVNMKCAANKVRSDMMRQKFHERPGMKRKRLLSERWRRRFKENFVATARRVEEIRRKGW